MAAFATMLAAEQRARAKMEDGTWIVAHVQRDINGNIGVRVIRKMAPGANVGEGAWVIINDDATV